MPVPALTGFLAWLAALPLAAAAAPGFRIETLAPGVHAAIRTDPPGLMVDANCLFIVNDADVVVVDAPEASQELIAALRKITDKPVSHLINTHWHDDHVIGNAAWRKAWPGIQFIAHPALRDYLPGKGAKNRAGMIEGAPQAAAYMQQQLDQGKNLAGQPISDEERQSYASDIALVAHYMQVVPGTPDVLPDLGLDGLLVLQRGSRRIEIRRLGRGHTEADLAVWLPQERVLASGDLVVWPVPLVGSEQSQVADWVRSLDALLALKPALIVPGHGPVLKDDAQVRLMRGVFDAVVTQVTAARGRGLDLEATRKAVTLDDWRGQFAGDSPVRDGLFRRYVQGPAVDAMWNSLQDNK
jgi:cyclase